MTRRQQNGSSYQLEFLRSEEGRIFVTGCCMLIGWVVASILLWRMQSPLWDNILTLGFSHMVAGKGVSIAHGMQAGMPHWLIAILATYVDVMAMLLLYPLLVFSYRNFFERRFFQKHMKKVFDSAQRNIGRMRRFKIAGIFVFVWFPFWMTGVVVGAVLGYLLGLRTWVTLTTAGVGTATSVLCWVYAYDRLFAWLGWVKEGIPSSVIIVALAALIAHRIVVKRRLLLRMAQKGLTGGGWSPKSPR
jgi:uncharacterized membrane protein